MDDNIRVSDADRERVSDRLREHFAEGRLTSEELEERITATLSAKTAGDLRAVMADLPDAAPLSAAASPPGWQPQWAPRRGGIAVRRPRILPLAIIALIVAIALPGAGWVFAAFVKVVLVIWLVACLAGLLAMARFRRHLRRQWRSGYGGHWHQYQWHGR